MIFQIGAGTIYALRTDIAGATPIKLGAVQETQIDFSGDLKPLYGQNQYALAIGRTKTKIEVESKFANIDGRTWNNTYFGGTLSSGSALTAENETQTIPSSSAYTVTATNAATWLQDLGVFYSATGLQLDPVASSPSVGQYTVAAGVYTFNSGDHGLAVLLNYLFNNSSAGRTLTIGNPRMGVTPFMKLVFDTLFQGQQAIFTINNAAAGKLTVPSKLDDWLINEIDWQVSADASGNIGTITFSQ